MDNDIFMDRWYHSYRNYSSYQKGRTKSFWFESINLYVIVSESAIYFETPWNLVSCNWPKNCKQNLTRGVNIIVYLTYDALYCGVYYICKTLFLLYLQTFISRNFLCQKWRKNCIFLPQVQHNSHPLHSVDQSKIYTQVTGE